jgi:helicase SWR1
MSSPNLDSMSDAHALNGVKTEDVSELAQMETSMSSDHLGMSVDLPVDSPTKFESESVKSLKTSATKRRKVSSKGPPAVVTRRETRSGGTIPPPPPSRTRAPSKRKSAEENKITAKATRQKQLHDTYETHDNKVRELFHLTKFVTLVDYDANTAKQDESEVFNDVAHPLLL